MSIYCIKIDNDAICYEAMLPSYASGMTFTVLRAGKTPALKWDICNGMLEISGSVNSRIFSLFFFFFFQQSFQ